MSDSNDKSARRDDDDLLPDYPTPSQGGSAGGELARDIGKRAEQKRATGGAAGVTRARKNDEVHPEPGTRSNRRGSGG